jgi:CDP-diacylglycerol pyrophosphatase
MLLLRMTTRTTMIMMSMVVVVVVVVAVVMVAIRMMILHANWLKRTRWDNPQIMRAILTNICLQNKQQHKKF